MSSCLLGQQIHHEFVQLQAQDGGRPHALYQTLEGRQPEIAFLSMHPRPQTFLHFALEPLAREGFGAFGMSPWQGDKSGIHEELLLDVAAGVKLLKSSGVEKVIFIGRSGGTGISAKIRASACATLPSFCAGSLRRGTNSGESVTI